MNAEILKLAKALFTINYTRYASTEDMINKYAAALSEYSRKAGVDTYNIMGLNNPGNVNALLSTFEQITQQSLSPVDSASTTFDSIFWDFYISAKPEIINYLISTITMSLPDPNQQYTAVNDLTNTYLPEVIRIWSELLKGVVQKNYMPGVENNSVFTYLSSLENDVNTSAILQDIKNELISFQLSLKA